MTPNLGASDEKAKPYARAKRKAWLLELALALGFLTAVSFTPAARALRSWVADLVSGWPLQTALFVTVLSAGFTLLEFPLTLYRSFVLEHRFGLSNLAFPKWLWDYIKQLLVGGLLSLLVIEGLVFIIHRARENWWLWATGGWFLWSCFLTWVMPVVLLPLFYRQRPLDNEALRQRLECFLERCGTRVRGIFEVNLSRTTKKANACLCGLGASRRVLISDTLLTSYPPEEVEVVLAHELGHHRKRHLGIHLGVGTLAVGLSFLAADYAVGAWGSSLGLSGIFDLAALPVAALVFLVVGTLLLPVTNGVWRFLEAQADRFALAATGNPEGFVAAMRRLAQQNLAELSPPRWVEWLLYDHPSLARRIAMAENLALSPGGRGMG